MITQFVLVALLVSLAVAFIGSFVFAALRLLPRADEPENRRAPIGMIAANEQARIASLKRVAERQHQHGEVGGAGCDRCDSRDTVLQRIAARKVKA